MSGADIFRWVLLLTAAATPALLSAAPAAKTDAPTAKKDVPTAKKDAPPATKQAETIDDVLDQFAARGRDIKAVAAELEEVYVDELTGQVRKRTGSVFLSRDADAGRIRIEIISAVGKKAIEEEYVFDGKVFWKINYRSRQIQGFTQSPGQARDVFEIGRGPFPLPIGQPREKIQKLFNTELVGPATADPVKVKLTPSESTDFARSHREFEFTASQTAGIPEQVVARDRAGRAKTIKLLNVKTNADAGDLSAKFAAPDPKADKFKGFQIDVR